MELKAIDLRHFDYRINKEELNRKVDTISKLFSQLKRLKIELCKKERENPLPKKLESA